MIVAPRPSLTGSGETIINTFITALFAEDLVERASADEPVVELLSANTKGFVETLSRSGGVAVN
jgi:hypothetical protein